MSGDIVQIRDYQPRVPSYGARREDPAMVIILPVVRIERVTDRQPRRRLPSLLTLRQKLNALRALEAAERGD